jgi:hypothetical protein
MSLNYSEINCSNEKINNKKRKNITIKNAKKPHEKIKLRDDSNNLGQHFLNNNGSDSEDDLGDFHQEQKINIPNPPQITNFPDKELNDNKPIIYDPDISSYSANQTSNNASYYEHFVPNYNTVANPQKLSGSQTELMTKLNNILHILEEQQENKTSNITEELILYLFLGVFIIFTVDSFTKVGKYTR